MKKTICIILAAVLLGGVGKWTRHVLKNANTPWGYDCSACGEWFVIGADTAERYNYCPNCGVKMEVSDDA